MLNIIFNHTIEFVVTLIVAFITFLYKKLMKYNDTIQHAKEGVKALLKNRIIEKYKYYKEIGTINIFDKQIVNELYREYENLGGNEIIHELVNDINALPIENELKKTIQKNS